MMAHCPNCDEDFYIQLEINRERELLRQAQETGKPPEKQCFKCWKKAYIKRLEKIKLEAE